MITEWVLVLWLDGHAPALAPDRRVYASRAECMAEARQRLEKLRRTHKQVSVSCEQVERD